MVSRKLDNLGYPILFPLFFMTINEDIELTCLLLKNQLCFLFPLLILHFYFYITIILFVHFHDIEDFLYVRSWPILQQLLKPV